VGTGFARKDAHLEHRAQKWEPVLREKMLEPETSGAKVGTGFARKDARHQSSPTATAPIISGR
jgi:hypothetical protein